MTEQQLIQQAVATLREHRAALTSGVDAVKTRTAAMIDTAREIVTGLSDSITHATKAQTAFGRCQKTVDAIGAALTIWKQDASTAAIEADAWSLRAKQALSEVHTVIDERDATHEHLAAWHQAVRVQAEAIGEMRTPPAAIESALHGMGSVDMQLRHLDPNLVGTLAASLSGGRTTVQNEVRGIVRQVSASRGRANLLTARLQNAATRVAALRRNGIAGQEELAEAIAAAERFSAEVAQISAHVHEFDAAVDQIATLTAELSQRVDEAARKDDTRRLLDEAAARMVDEREMLGRSAGLAVGPLDERISDLATFLTPTSRVMAAVDATIDGTFALTDRVASAAASTVARAIPETVKSSVLSVQTAVLSQVDEVTFDIRRRAESLRVKLPAFVVARLDYRRARREGSLPDDVLIAEMNAGSGRSRAGGGRHRLQPAKRTRQKE